MPAKSRKVGKKSTFPTNASDVTSSGIPGPRIYNGILVDVSYGCFFSHGRLN